MSVSLARGDGGKSAFKGDFYDRSIWFSNRRIICTFHKGPTRADRLARYPEKERGEIITRALVLLESQGSPQGQLTGNDATITSNPHASSQVLMQNKASLSTLVFP